MQDLDEDAVGSLDEGNAEAGADGSWLPHERHTMLPQCHCDPIQIVYRYSEVLDPEKGRIRGWRRCWRNLLDEKFQAAEINDHTKRILNKTATQMGGAESLDIEPRGGFRVRAPQMQVVE
jgi:hypothetical protein